MKKTLAVIFIFVLSWLNANSQVKGFGVGVIVGEPTGLCAKGWLSSSTAIDGAIAWSFTDKSSLHLHADYLWHTSSLVSSTTGTLPLYVGIGGRVKFVQNDNNSSDTRIGVRIPVGLSYQFNTIPVDIFVELVPILDLSPKTELNGNGGLGVRYYFH
jgi:hypothetical protein